jgi:RNA polymerase sigma-70 factor, ECF subfamily
MANTFYHENVKLSNRTCRDCLIIESENSSKPSETNPLSVALQDLTMPYWPEPFWLAGVARIVATMSIRSGVDDWNLVAQARDGDSEAFACLVRRYHVPLIHFVQRMTGSQQDAEDLAQETFIRVYRHLGRLEPQAKFSTTLFAIGRNLTLNFLRDSKRRGRYQTHSLTRDDETDRLLEARTPGPAQVARHQEIDAFIERALAMLSPEHREVLVLRELQGLDYAAIATVVGCRKGTVKSRIARARDHLRQCMKELGGDLL